MKKEKKFKLVIGAFIIFLITYSIVLKQAYMGGTDYNVHMQSIYDIHMSSLFQYLLHENSYPIWHLWGKVIYKIGSLIGMPLEYAVAIATALINVSLYVIIEHIFEMYVGTKNWLIGVVALLVGPIYIPWFNSTVYLGQGSPNTWHNPTNLAVKPFAICAFFFAVKMISDIQKQGAIVKKDFVVTTILFVLSALAKPSFLQGFLPTLWLYVFVCVICSKGAHFLQYLYVLLTTFPIIFVLGYQFIVSFFTGEKGEGIGIGWLVVMGSGSPNVYISALLVLGFPGLYLLFNLKELIKSTELKIGWLYLMLSWLEGALLYENGERMYHGNFTWGLQIAYTIIWIISICKFGANLKKESKNDCKNVVLFIVLLLHLVCGIYYIYRLLFLNEWY